jgi:hypothetical protein
MAPSAKVAASKSAAWRASKVSLLSITNPPDKSLEVFDNDNSEMHSSVGLGTLCHQFGHLGDITVRFEFSEGC